MTPRLMGLPQQLQQYVVRPLQHTSPLAFLNPQLQQTRNASILSSLSNSDAYNKRIRRGRGPASGKGKTSGRGHKGQNQHGKVPAGFTGGQTPDIIVHGERGFNNFLAPDMAPVNLSRIQDWIDQKRLDPSKPITVRELAKSNCIHHYKDGVKVLGDGASALKQPIHLVVSRASASAISAIEAVGGTVTTRFYTRAALRHIVAKETHPFISMQWSVDSGPKALLEAAGIEPTPDGVLESTIMKEKGLRYRLPDPTSRRDIEYYRDPAHRGYLSHLLKPSEGPSLFFRAPEERKSAAGVKKEKVLPENRLW
ncbi:54S ribosomal protein L10 [Penicillium chermesinum]|uniref:54S ribosomal protein L10 n=1 Tax=Penicillium chermesinum TaxID=63820 RepID=A0A9W9TM68_9EURO|nr:54S ribosomal protein L10 [Penicillium chermesinum]KAJ5226205.1 54S ribosomal protein L10 [Penicillium chermesinum]KAJ6160608.1 54S ribosomal protein L10 [Penicillium chermesinum]